MICHVTTMNVDVLRLTHSSYFKPDFAKREEQALLAAGARHYGDRGENPLVVLTNSQSALDQLTESQLQRLKLLIHANSGYDNFSPQWVQKAPFPIVLGHQLRTQAVVETNLSALWEKLAPVPDHRTWSAKRQFPRKMLKDLGVLILGHGQIGRLLAQCLRPLAREVQIFDPFQDLLQLDLSRAQVVFVCTSLNPTTRHFINHAFLEQLPRGFFLFNTARGEVVDLPALLVALEGDPEAYAYLDVFENEPYPLEQLAFWHERGQLKTSSHLAGVYQNLDQALIDFECTVLRDFLDLPRPSFERRYRDQDLRGRVRGDFLL